jgi:hypothetical protein
MNQEKGRFQLAEPLKDSIVKCARKKSVTEVHKSVRANREEIYYEQIWIAGKDGRGIDYF